MPALAVPGYKAVYIDLGGVSETVCIPTNKVENQPTEGGKPIQMLAYVENADETCKKAIAPGGSVAMEPYDDEGGRMCGIADSFESLWWLKSGK